MSRSEKLILVRDAASSIITALDAILAAQGLERIAVETIREDFSPILAEEGGPLAFVLSAPRSDWIACFTSLSAEAEADLAETIAIALEQPLVHVVLGGDDQTIAYRYWENGQLHEEALPGSPAHEVVDEASLLERLAQHGIDVSLVDDRTAGFGDEHVVVGYTMRRANESARLN